MFILNFVHVEALVWLMMFIIGTFRGAAALYYTFFTFHACTLLYLEMFLRHLVKIEQYSNLDE